MNTETSQRVPPVPPAKRSAHPPEPSCLHHLLPVVRVNGSLYVCPNCIHFFPAEEILNHDEDARIRLGTDGCPLSD